jgi:hypothetical protein
MTRRSSVIASLVLSLSSPLSLPLLGGLALSGACDQPAPPAAPPPPAPTPPPTSDAGAPKPKMVANPDGLSLADRIAKRQAAEKKVADALAAEEQARLVKYDRGKLPLHTQVFAFITKTRATYDKLEPKVVGAKDAAKAKAEIDKTAAGFRPSIVAMGKKMATIDPKGGNSNVTTDYDVMLNALANDYPEALQAAVDGDGKPLADQKAELDKRTKKITDWLAELREKK